MLRASREFVLDYREPVIVFSPTATSGELENYKNAQRLMSTSVATETFEYDLSPWAQLFSRNHHAFL
jgi:hypothetical protein